MTRAVNRSLPSGRRRKGLLVLHQQQVSSLTTPALLGWNQADYPRQIADRILFEQKATGGMSEAAVHPLADVVYRSGTISEADSAFVNVPSEQDSKLRPLLFRRARQRQTARIGA